MSLMEVLIAMFVLSIGLLGVAALIPVGRLAIVEAGKADRSGACGRAALSEIKVRQMLDYRFWAPGAAAPSWWDAVRNAALPPGPNPQIPFLDAFAIDPLGVASQMPLNLGGATGSVIAVVPRITLKSFPSLLADPPSTSKLSYDQADRIFTWHDDLEFSLPKDIKPPPTGDSKRPLVTNPSGSPDFAGHYSWLVTVAPAAAELALPVADKSLFSVSVVVCYRRSYSISEYGGLPVGEHFATVEFPPGNVAYGGGSVRLTWQGDSRDPAVRLRENEWIMLCGKVPDNRCVPPWRTVCKWYRVVAADTQTDTQSPAHYVSLVGPDWTADSNGDGQLDATAVAIDHVVGVYTTTVELDRNLVWNK